MRVKPKRRFEGWLQRFRKMQRTRGREKKCEGADASRLQGRRKACGRYYNGMGFNMSCCKRNDGTSQWSDVQKCGVNSGRFVVILYTCKKGASGGRGEGYGR